MRNKFWIIGGEYTSTDFARMVTGTEKIFGPLATREEAMSVWRDESEKHRGDCHVRYVILSDANGAAMAMA